jgi:hypothetical protein
VSKFTSKEELRRWHLDQAERSYKALAEVEKAYKQATSARERKELHEKSMEHVMQAELHESAAEVLK